MELDKYSDKEILKLWPQAKGELKGFERVLRKNSGITAAQLRMAIQLADIGFSLTENQIRQRKAFALRNSNNL